MEAKKNAYYDVYEEALNIYAASLRECLAVGADRKRMAGYLAAKRLFDIVLSMASFLFLLPVFLTVPVLIRLDSKGPIFFAQKRIGKNGKPFMIYKFRSMCTDAERLLSGLNPGQRAEYEKNYKLHNDFRVTRVGRMLRKTNIDELPQLFNILKGDLSFVGPRPVVEREIEKYGRDRDCLLSATPGLTGYWQVNRRRDTTYEQRMRMELYYVGARSFLMDIRLIFQTFAVVFAK